MLDDLNILASSNFGENIEINLTSLLIIIKQKIAYVKTHRK